MLATTLYRPMPRRLALCAALVALTACGCGDGASGAADRPHTAPVSGSVVQGGKPVDNATITFIPEPGSPGRGAFATTDASGKFELRTFVPGDGAVPAKYKVTISKVKRSGELTTEQSQAYFEKHGTPPPDPKETDLLPAKYKDVNKTPLTGVEVKDGSNELPPFDVSK